VCIGVGSLLRLSFVIALELMAMAQGVFWGGFQVSFAAPFFGQQFANCFAAATTTMASELKQKGFSGRTRPSLKEPLPLCMTPLNGSAARTLIA